MEEERREEGEDGEHPLMVVPKIFPLMPPQHSPIIIPPTPLQWMPLGPPSLAGIPLFSKCPPL